MSIFTGIAQGLGQAGSDLYNVEQDDKELKLKQTGEAFKERQLALGEKRLDAQDKRATDTAAATAAYRQSRDPVHLIEVKSKMALGIDPAAEVPPERKEDYDRTVQRLSGMMPQSRFNYFNVDQAGNTVPDGTPHAVRMVYDSIMQTTSKVPGSEGVIVPGMLPKPEAPPNANDTQLSGIIDDAIKRKSPVVPSAHGLNAASMRRLDELAISTGRQLPVPQQLNFEQQKVMETIRNQSKEAAKTYKLSATAAKDLSTVDTALYLTGKAGDQLRQIVKDNNGQWPSDLNILWEYTKYNKGHGYLGNVDPRLRDYLETISLGSIIATMPYMRGMRNFIWVQEIQKHVPSVFDNPQQAVEKVDALHANLPFMEQAIKHYDLMRFDANGNVIGGDPVTGLPTTPTPQPKQGVGIPAASPASLPQGRAQIDSKGTNYEVPPPEVIAEFKAASPGIAASVPPKAGYRVVANPGENNRLYYQSVSDPKQVIPTKPRPEAGPVSKPGTGQPKRLLTPASELPNEN